MNEQQIIDLLREILAWCVAALVGLVAVIFGWITFAQRKLTSRMDMLEQCAVTSEEFQRAFNDIREDRKEMHLDNKAAIAELKRFSESQLDRIEKKIDVNEERSAKTRHEIRNYVMNLSQKVAVLDSHNRHETK